MTEQSNIVTASESASQAASKSAADMNEKGAAPALSTKAVKPATDLNVLAEETAAPKEPIVESKALPNAREPAAEIKPAKFGWNDSPFMPHGFQPRAQLLKTPKASVMITVEAYQKMRLYVEIAGKEVGWLGTVSLLEDDVFLIHDTFLLEQEVTAAETELSSEGQTRLVEDFLAEGEAGFDKINQLRFWGHSHVRMGTSPSYTDENTMRRFMDEGMEWYVRGIFNKLGRAEFTVYFFDMGLAFCDVPWCVIDQTTGKKYLERGRTAAGNGYYNRDHDAYGPTVIGTRPAYHRDTSQYYSPKPAVPPELVPSEELRPQIISEFEAKVTDRIYGFGFLTSWLAPDPEPVVRGDDSLTAEEREAARAGTKFDTTNSAGKVGVAGHNPNPPGHPSTDKTDSPVQPQSGHTVDNRFWLFRLWSWLFPAKH